MRRRFFLSTVGATLAAAGLTVPASATLRERSRAFIRAVTDGDLARVRAMAADDASLVYARDEAGRSAYVLAHLHGHSHIASFIADQGILMDAVEATLARNWERVDEIGATAPGSFNLDHPAGGTALWAAAWSGVGRDMWRLQQYGASPDANPRGANGVTPDRAAVGMPDPWAALEAAAHLLGNGGHPNTPQRGRSSVLHGAAASGSTDLVRLVLRKGGDPHATDDAGRTPLAVAEAAGHAGVVALLREPSSVQRDHRTSRFAYHADGSAYRADGPIPARGGTAPDPVASSGVDTPSPGLRRFSGIDPRLQSRVVGVSHGNEDATRDLVASDPELAHSISYVDEAAVEAAAHTGRRPIVSYLLENGAPYSLPTATTMGDIEWARTLLDEDPLRVFERGAHDFPLMWYPAIGGGSVAMAELLLEYGADIEQEHTGTTALHFAVRGGQAELVAFLLERGADPDAIGRRFRREGETPLDHATARDRPEIAEALRAAGARLRIATEADRRR